MICNRLRRALTLAAIYFQSGTVAASPTAGPKRIISMSLASDEVLVDLIPECGGFNRIAALSTLVDDTTSSNVTQAAKQVQGRVHSEPESLLKYNPDLVIAASFNRPEIIKLLRNRKVNMLVLDQFSSANDIAQHILSIGNVTRCESQAKKIHAEFFRKLNAESKITEKNSKKISVLNYSPDLTLMGKDTLFDDLVTRAGAINLASQGGLRLWPKIDAETLLSFQPDKIIILGEDSDSLRGQITGHPIWKKIGAVKRGAFIFINPKEALSTSHYFANAVTKLRQKLNDHSTAPN